MWFVIHHDDDKTIYGPFMTRQAANGHVNGLNAYGVKTYVISGDLAPAFALAHKTIVKPRPKKTMTVEEYKRARSRARSATRWLRSRSYQAYDEPNVREAALKAVTRALARCGFAQPGAAAFMIVSTCGVTP